jgi:hypothetical protein
MGVLAFLNTLLAAIALVVFARLAWRTKTTIRFIYGAACPLMVYIMLIYGHLFATGEPLGYDFTRPATGYMLIFIVSVGVYELFRN